MSQLHSELPLGLVAFTYHKDLLSYCNVYITVINWWKILKIVFLQICGTVLSNAMC